MSKEVLNKFIVPALAFITMGIISTFLFGKLDKMSDTQIDILQRVTAVEVQITGLENSVNGLVETQGTVKGDAGDNKFELRMVNRRLDNIEDDVKEIKNN